MTGTASYLAGAESNAVQLSYGIEATWGEAPATLFQAIRSTGESLTGTKKRDRPAELSVAAQVSQAVTMSLDAAGDINFAFSYGQYDDLIASMLNSAWSADLAIVGVSGDISAASTGNELVSTTSGKFSNVAVGQWVKSSGFSTGANNGWARVTSKPDNTHIVVTGLTLVDETPAGTAAHIKGSMIRNSNSFLSLFIQKQLGASQYLTYPGSQITGLTLNADQGKFAEGKFTVLAQQQLKATSDSSTGGVTAAPTNVVMDTIRGFTALTLGGSAISAAVKTINLELSKTGAAADYALGAAQAAGMRIGRLEGKGTLAVYFKDFTLFDLFTSEAASVLSWELLDPSGASSYRVTLPYATLMNPKIVAGGPDQPVMATFDLEANPDPTLGFTVQLDRVT